MIKGKYIIESETAVERNCYMGIPHIIMQTIINGIAKLKEEAKGNLTDNSEIDIIVPRRLYDMCFFICDVNGNTAMSIIRSTFRQCNILLRVGVDECDDEKITCRAYV